MEHAPELRDLTLRMYRALASGDVGFFERLSLPPGGLVGHRHRPPAWWPDHASLVGAFPFTPGDPLAYREGEEISRCSALLKNILIAPVNTVTLQS